MAVGFEVLASRLRCWIWSLSAEDSGPGFDSELRPVCTPSTRIVWNLSVHADGHRDVCLHGIIIPRIVS